MIPEKERARTSTASTVAPAREVPRLHLEPGQPHSRTKLTDEVESMICERISEGLAWQDAARLSGVHRSTVWNWKIRGQAFNENPDEQPEDARFGVFVERLAIAESRCKETWVKRVAKDPDWRALAFLLKAHWPKEFCEFVRQELSGPDGQAIEVHQTNPFRVEVHLEGPSDIKWTTIDHSQPHKESAVLPDPFARPAEPPVIVNLTEQMAESVRNQRNARSRWSGVSQFDPLGSRGRVGDEKARK
jgi:hypothetical protein